MSYPSKKEILSILDKIESKERKGYATSTRPFPENGSSIDKAKYQACDKIREIRDSLGLRNTDLATLLQIDPATVSKIAHYHIDKFKLDSLMAYLEVMIISLRDEKKLRDFKKSI